ncbi:MAG: FkbM family methyltransferase [Gemmatimonadota bacterium]
MATRLPFPVRRALSRLLGPVRVRIRSGPNAGSRWSMAAAGRHAGGRFEEERVQLLQALVAPGDCFWDVGAHHGYVTLLASRRVGSGGRVFSFEPSPYNFSFLRRHVAWNDLRNVELRNVGLGATRGVVHFGGSGSSQTFRVGGGGERVELTTVADLLEAGVAPPDVVKIDVEGSEGDILEAGAPHLPAHCVAIVSLHGDEARSRSLAALAEQGFHIVESHEVARLSGRDDWGHDPDIVALGPASGFRPDTIRQLPGFA